MQKKIIVLAIAAALAAPAMAFADASVYGQVNLAIDVANTGTATNSVSNNKLSSYGSRLGFKGSESLGGDTSIVWNLESGVGVDDGTTASGQFFSRESNVGLSSASMGTVTAGRQASPYKASTRRLDMFGDTAAGKNGFLGGSHDDSASNAISYKSPSLSGFTVIDATVFGAEPASSTDKKGSAIGLAAQYEQGPMYVMFALDNKKQGSTGSGQLGGIADNEDNAYTFGGSYAMDAITVSATFEQITKKSAGVDTKNNGFYLGGKFAISSSDAIKLAYAKRGATTGATNDGSRVTIGYDHGMSPNTSVYALYNKDTNNGVAADPSVLSIGLKHSF